MPVEHRTDHVDHPAGLHVARVAVCCLSRRKQPDAVAQLPAGGELLVAAGGEDRAVDTTAAHQPAVGSIHYCVDVLIDDVPAHDHDLHAASTSHFARHPARQ